MNASSFPASAETQESSFSSAVRASWSEYGKGLSATEPLVVDKESQRISALDDPWNDKQRYLMFKILVLIH